MQVDQTSKCAHAPCKCLAERGSEFCSTYCQDAQASDLPQGQEGCRCGHAGCDPSAGVPQSAVGGG